MWHFDRGIHGIPTYKIDTLEEFLFWESLKETKNRKEKEATTMQVTYNGFTGALVKLERVSRDRRDAPMGEKFSKLPFDLSIYDSEKNVTYSFTGVKLEDAKFLCGEVMFGG